MIEERARVLAVDVGFAWVDSRRQTACGACSANQACATATLAKVLGQRRVRMRVLNQLPLQVGDEVIIGIAEDALVRGSLAVYIMPLLLLFLGALLAKLIAPGSEALSILFGTIGLLGGSLWLRSYSGRISNDARWQATVLRRCGVKIPTQNRVLWS